MALLYKYHLRGALITLLVATVCIVISGCKNTPIKVENLKIKSTKVDLPIEGTVKIDISTEQRYKTHTVYDPRGPWRPTLAEGSLMESAALKTFSRGFSNVISGSNQEAHLVVKTRSRVETSYNTGIHSAEVIARIERLDNTVIGEYKGSGSEISKDIANAIALENSFIKAFMQILYKLFSDDEFLALIEDGYFQAPPGQ